MRKKKDRVVEVEARRLVELAAVVAYLGVAVVRRHPLDPCRPSVGRPERQDASVLGGDLPPDLQRDEHLQELLTSLGPSPADLLPGLLRRRGGRWSRDRKGVRRAGSHPTAVGASPLVVEFCRLGQNGYGICFR